MNQLSLIIGMLGAAIMLGGCRDKMGASAPEAKSSAQQATHHADASTTRGRGASQTWTFDEVRPGDLPSGFTVATGEWSVVQAANAPSGEQVVAQTAENDRSVYNALLVPPDVTAGDLDASVKLRASRGDIDRGGGLVWRARDAQNYYIARYNPLEDNFRVYKVVGGNRRELGSADVRVDHGAWHTLRVTMQGDHIEGYLDGQKHLDVHDDTFTEPGQIGLWTKADAQTQFDDLTLKPLVRQLDARAVGKALGADVKTGEDGVLRATWPRTEVKVVVDGMPFPPPAGLTTWAAFSSTPAGAMMMGDTVVFQDEVSAAMDAAFANGLEITALHNHFFYDEPKVYFMHVGGHGDAEALARGVKAVWAAIRAVRQDHPTPLQTFPGEAPTSGGSIDAREISRIIGEEASTNEGVVKVTVGRQASMHGSTFGKSLGLSTWAAFTGSDAHAAIDGDFAMTADEVQPVLRALRRSNIHVVALHNHMIGEAPAYHFTHFWAKGPAVELARGFKAALDAQREVHHGNK